MPWWNPFARREERATIFPNGSIASSSQQFRELVAAWTGDLGGTPVRVTVDNAIGVPAFGAAVNFLSGTLAGLPQHVYQVGNDGNRERQTDKLAQLLHDAVNDGMSSFEWRKYTFEQVFTTGRAFTFIERNAKDEVTDLWPLDPGRVTVKMEGGEKVYRFKERGSKEKIYRAKEIIDLPFMLKPDGLQHRGPVASNRDTLALAIAVTRYGSRFFDSGGVPPFVVTGNFQAASAVDRASTDIHEGVKRAAREGRNALVLPNGMEIKVLGTDMEKAQMVELQRFLIEQIARIFSLPPTFLQDLTHGTFSNTEQQDLHFVKHTLRRWVEQVEQEMNLKLFGRGPRTRYVELNVDGLLRGDFRTRMEGYAKAIQHSVMLPNEARRAENRPDVEGGDVAYMQGAMMPINQLTTPPAEGDGNDD